MVSAEKEVSVNDLKIPQSGWLTVFKRSSIKTQKRILGEVEGRQEW